MGITGPRAHQVQNVTQCHIFLQRWNGLCRRYGCWNEEISKQSSRFFADPYLHCSPPLLKPVVPFTTELRPTRRFYPRYNQGWSCGWSAARTRWVFGPAWATLLMGLINHTWGEWMLIGCNGIYITGL